ncbi:MAG: class I SAM-dependent methyltransferase [Actinomycetota bacterium]
MDEATKESLRIWDALAPGYDRHRAMLNELEGPVTERLYEAMDPHEGDTLLELTAGAGEVGLRLAERRPDVHVIISDFAPSMVAVSARAVAERGAGNVETRQIDAQDIGFENSSVDGVISRYGIMLIPDHGKALGEIRRVLKPGRTLAYAVWGPLAANAWMMMMGATLMQRGHFTPPEGGGFFPLTTAEENQEAAIKAGFDHVEVDVLDHPHAYPSFEAYWELATELSGPLVEIVKSLSDEERRAVHDQMKGFCEGFRDGDGYVLPAQRLFVRAW